MLTGKNKEQFNNWYIGNHQQGRFFQLTWFEQLPVSMQWGVIQDYADSIGIEMWVEKAVEEFRYWYNIYEPNGDVHYNQGFKTRDEARKAAIKAFDEIVNSAT